MKTKKVLALGLAFLLTSCGGNGTSKESSSSSEDSSIEEGSLEEALEAMHEGYTSLGIYKYGYEYMGYSYKYVEGSAKKKEYVCKSYQESSSENPSMDVIASSYRYAPYKNGYKTILAEVELGLDNEIHYYGVTDSNGSYVSWSDSGYANRFNILKSEDFEYADGYYSLKMDDDSNSLFYESIGSQLTGQIGLTLASFKVKLEGSRLTDYVATFEPIETTYGNYNTEVSGKFTAYGETVIKDLSPLEGEEDSLFSSTISKLKEQNYHLDVSLSSKKISVDVENGANVIYDIYNKKNVKTNSYGYYQKTLKTVQGIVRLNGKIYEDSAEISGYMSSLLPTFAISSLFFSKTQENGNSVYTLKENVECTISSQAYGTMAGSNAGNLVITISSDKVVVENKLKLSDEVFTYSNFGNIEGLIDDLQEDSSNLKWSDILANQEAETSILYQSISSSVLDEIPTFGGDNLMAVLDASYNKAKPVIALAFDDYNSGVALQTAYLAKLKENGFLESETSSSGDYFIKEVTINGEKVKVGALVYLAADYFQTTQLLLYPSIVK